MRGAISWQCESVGGEGGLCWQCESVGGEGGYAGSVKV